MSKTTMRERLPQIVEMIKEDLPLLLERKNSDRDKRGDFTRTVMGDYRSLGIDGYILDGDVGEFRRLLAEAAALKRELIDRFEQGDPIAKSTVSITTYMNLLDALAATDFGGAVQLAEVMKDRGSEFDESPHIEVEGSDDAARAFFYALKAFVLDRRGDMQHWTLAFERAVRQERETCFAGYPQVLRGILDDDLATVNQGLQVAVEGHIKESKGSGIFAGVSDELLCVWGIGIANLARHRGLAVDAVPPLIPEELLVQT